MVARYYARPNFASSIWKGEWYWLRSRNEGVYVPCGKGTLVYHGHLLADVLEFYLFQPVRFERLHAT
jgi:hypothetical protein